MSNIINSPVVISYPVNKENLTALLDYFYPKFPLGNIDDLLENLITAKFTLQELEIYAHKLLLYPDEIRRHLNDKFIKLPKRPPNRSNLIGAITGILGRYVTQSNLLGYSIDIFYHIGWNNICIDLYRYYITTVRL